MAARVAIPESKWRWFGMAGHFICGSDCLHHMATKVGKYLISTVGEMRRRRPDGSWSSPEEIGSGRTFETMVFKLAGGECGCGCGLPSIIPSEIDFLPANDHKTADANHLKLCRKYARKVVSHTD